MSKISERVGLVVIGRNEGDLLRQCLHSAVGKVANIVYVDSGSTDTSIELANSLGIEVVQLDLSIPFTAARARNAGFTRLLSINEQIEFVQFVDGDCEIAAEWLKTAQTELEKQVDVSVVCGRRRERWPEKSIYNLLCDIEWNTPIGEAQACGGDSMMRVSAFQQVGGFNPTLIAGEEPELCVRLRQQGWKILRIDAEMTIHDAAITQFSQWWTRSVRAGYAYAEGFRLHGASPERHWAKESKSIWFWGLILPVIILGLVWSTKGLSLLLLLGYPLIGYKIYRFQRRQNYGNKDSCTYAIYCILSKIPQVQGQIQFHINRILGRKRNLIEYKNLSVPLKSVK